MCYRKLQVWSGAGPRECCRQHLVARDIKNSSKEGICEPLASLCQALSWAGWLHGLNGQSQGPQKLTPALCLGVYWCVYACVSMWAFRLALGKSIRPYIHSYILPKVFLPLSSMPGLSTLTPSNAHPQHVSDSEVIAPPGHWPISKKIIHWKFLIDKLIDKCVHLSLANLCMWREHLKSIVLAIPNYITVVIKLVLFNSQVDLLTDSSCPADTLLWAASFQPTTPVFLSDFHMKLKTVELTETKSVHLL